MSDTYSVSYSPQALEDMKDIYSYLAYELQEPGTAKNLVNRIRQEVRTLDTMPFRYESVDWEPWKSLGLRKVAIGHFIVFYRVISDEKEVIVIRIVYGGRDLKNIINKL